MGIYKCIVDIHIWIMSLHRSVMILYCSYRVIDRHYQIMVPHDSILDLHKTNIVLGDSIYRSQYIDSCNSITRLIGFSESLDAALEI